MPGATFLRPIAPSTVALREKGHWTSQPMMNQSRGLSAATWPTLVFRSAAVASVCVPNRAAPEEGEDGHLKRSTGQSTGRSLKSKANRLDPVLIIRFIKVRKDQYDYRS